MRPSELEKRRDRAALGAYGDYYRNLSASAQDVIDEWIAEQDYQDRVQYLDWLEAGGNAWDW